MSELHLLSPNGFKAGTAYAGIRSKPKADVALLLADAPAMAAAVFTTNRVFAAPVQVGRKHVKSGRLRGVVVNAGNANACTGKQGEVDALRMCVLAASVASRSLPCKPSEILPSSTGIIGHLLPMAKVERGIIEAGQFLGSSAEHALLFADAILTTDLVRKTAAVKFKVGRETVIVAGACKGSGMIGPKMSLAGPPQATMLGYLTTDAKLTAGALRKSFSAACDGSFNAVTVDDHCSTNDTAVLLASGASGANCSSGKALASFTKAVAEVTRSLAYQIAADGEGATKVVRITVSGAKSEGDARTMARSIANSPLVKCAMHGNDPNWGRIVSAAGMAGVAFNPDKARLTLQAVRVFDKGRPLTINADALSNAMDAREVVIDLSCGTGRFSATVYTCDFSKEYVTINADYHT